MKSLCWVKKSNGTYCKNYKMHNEDKCHIHCEKKQKNMFKCLVLLFLGSFSFYYYLNFYEKTYVTDLVEFQLPLFIEFKEDLTVYIDSVKDFIVNKSVTVFETQYEYLNEMCKQEKLNWNWELNELFYNVYVKLNNTWHMIMV